MIKEYLSSQNMRGIELAKALGVSSATAHRIITGKFFNRVRPMFRSLYEKTGLTPNDILDIPPQKDVSKNEISE